MFKLLDKFFELLPLHPDFILYDFMQVAGRLDSDLTTLNCDILKPRDLIFVIAPHDNYYDTICNSIHSYQGSYLLFTQHLAPKFINDPYYRIYFKQIKKTKPAKVRSNIPKL